MSRANKGMTIDEAVAIGSEIAYSRAKYGAQASINRRSAEIIEAISVLVKAYQDVEQTIQTEIKAELTTANRRYAALNARYQKLLKKEDKEDRAQKLYNIDFDEVKADNDPVG